MLTTYTPVKQGGQYRFTETKPEKDDWTTTVSRLVIWTAFRPCPFHVERFHHGLGFATGLILYGKAQVQANSLDIDNITISLSYSKEYAITFVTAEASLGNGN